MSGITSTKVHHASCLLARTPAPQPACSACLKMCKTWALMPFHLHVHVHASLIAAPGMCLLTQHLSFFAFRCFRTILSSSRSHTCMLHLSHVHALPSHVT